MNIYKLALDKYGLEAQFDQCIEELAELIVALRHNKRLRNTAMDVLNEIADVEIMLEQMKLIFGEHEYEACKMAKLARLGDRLK